MQGSSSFASPLLLGLLLAAGPALGQDGKAPWEDFGSRIKSSESVAAHGPDLFGDNVSLSNGALSFSVTDLSIPGNGPSVAFTRTYQTRDWKRRKTDQMLADWEIEIPHISSINAQDWVASDGSNARCTVGGAPNQYESSGVSALDFWQGLSISIPGKTSGELLRRSAGTASPGSSYVWMTNDQAHATCLGSIANGSGEGFQVVTADGTRYWFNWMGQSYEPPLRRGFTTIVLTWLPYQPREYH